jgi:hypothetical protein
MEVTVAAAAAEARGSQPHQGLALNAGDIDAAPAGGVDALPPLGAAGGTLPVDRGSQETAPSDAATGLVLSSEEIPPTQASIRSSAIPAEEDLPAWRSSAGMLVGGAAIVSILASAALLCTFLEARRVAFRENSPQRRRTELHESREDEEWYFNARQGLREHTPPPKQGRYTPISTSSMSPQSRRAGARAANQFFASP